jgi:glycosyltransferase involved in cell wall biosynthesis
LALGHPHVGQGVYSLRLIQGLLDRISEQFVVAAPSCVAKPGEIPAENFVQLAPPRRSRSELLRRVFSGGELLRFVAQEFPDAVFHSPSPIWGLARPARTVITLHDCIYRHFTNYNGRFYLRRLLLNATERYAAGASLVLTDSEFSRGDLITQARIPEHLVHVLYPWVANAFLRPISAESISALRLRLNLPEICWLYLGGYDHRKNVPTLLRAYAAALRSRPLPPLVLAGAIPRRVHRSTCDVFGTLRELGLHSDQVLLPGTIGNRDLPALYKAASLFIFPSLMEGFGLPPAEAIAVGTPVLSADNSSLPEVVARKESLFDATRPAELTQKLLAAVDNADQFACTLPHQFTETFGIDRYLRLLEQASNSLS